MKSIDSDPQLSKLAAQYFARAASLQPDISVAQIEETFAFHMDEAALSPRSLHGYWEVMAKQQPLNYMGITYSPDRRLLEVNGKAARLSTQPLKIMTYMLYRSEEVVEYSDLYRLVGAKDIIKAQGQIRTNIQRVRTGIFDNEHDDGTWDWIQTIQGVGLCLINRERLYELATTGELPFSARLVMST